MPSAYIITNSGIIQISGTTQAINGLRNAVVGIADDLAPVINTGLDAQSLGDFINNINLVGSQNYPTAIKIVGSVAFGIAAAAAAPAALGIAAGTIGFVIAGTAAGWVAGEIYNRAFDNASQIGTALAGSLPVPNPFPTLDLPKPFEKPDSLNISKPSIPGTCRPSDAVGTSFDLAQRPPRRDPLMLDLNGDGEISHTGAANSSAYFDHDLDGVRTKTGWVTGGDGLLVLDVNGTIDNGSELFGDHFTKTRATAAGAAGQFARDGFDALASLDKNADGYVDAADAQFAQLKVWVDANADGISQAGELRSLAAATTNAAGTPVGITRFNVTPSAVTTTNTANGNQTAAQGSFQTTAGTSATLDSVTMQDVNLGQDTFHSQFIDAIPITTAAAHLAFMNGSGLVRSTQEAASLATVRGAVFAQALAQFAAMGTRAEQLAANQSCFGLLA